MPRILLPRQSCRKICHLISPSKYISALSGRTNLSIISKRNACLGFNRFWLPISFPLVNSYRDTLINASTISLRCVPYFSPGFVELGPFSHREGSTTEPISPKNSPPVSLYILFCISLLMGTPSFCSSPFASRIMSVNI